MSRRSKSNYLDILQIFRGLAAAMVVLHHSIGSLKYYHKIDYSTLNYVGSIGKYGVDFFFVLSGFIITYSAYYKYNEPNSFSNYIKNRLIRIYVPYLPIGIFMLVIYTLLPSFSNGNRDISLLTSLTLIPQGNPALSVAWTLSFELCFYLLFSISFYSKKAWNWFVLVWFLAIIIFTHSSLFSLPFLENPYFRILFSPYNIEFILGFVLALSVIRKIRINIILLFLLLLLALISFFYCTFNNLKLFPFVVNLLFAIVAFLSIFMATSFGNFKINKTSVIMMVGNATYSIYLIHNPLQMILIRLYPKITSITSLMVALVLVLILSCVVGYAYYFIFEKKAMNSIKSKLIK
ncbi:acyltransferase family protein [Flavobacterium lacustre]|uniref:acyltransferase family protein n=1 Tax=Flavobacterium lacustre TaxID=3016339 RepID=UPI0022B752CD|nr:acyltransferase [Flavobacterium lacustre]